VHTEDYNTPEFELVSRSMDRFFNHGEVPLPDQISDLSAHEKMDGSLVTLWYHNGWKYRTRSMIMPDNQINAWDRTWKDLIEESLGWEPGGFKYYLDKDDDYIFEVTGEENRVVVRYDNNKPATLLAIRNRVTGMYCNELYVDGIAKACGWDRPRRYTFTSFEEVASAAAALPNLEEGYVMYKGGVPVVKCKNPAYVAAHHLRGEGLNPKRCLQLVCMGEVCEYLAVFPEDSDRLAPYVGLLENTLKNITQTYLELAGIVVQKEFAAEALKHSFSSCLFNMRAKGISAKDAFFFLNEKAQHTILGSYL
jgi:hypothetical protein